MEEDGRGWRRMEEDGGGWKRMEEDGGGEKTTDTAFRLFGLDD